MNTARRSDPLAVALGVGATWSLTQLATRDKLTAKLRTRALRRLVHRRHHLVHASLVTIPGADPTSTGARWTGQTICSCGWDERHNGHMRGQVRSAMHHDAVDHLASRRATDPGKLVDMADCPWCLSFWAAIPVAVALVALGRLRLRDALWFPLAARIVAGAGTVHLGPDDDAPPVVDDSLITAEVDAWFLAYGPPLDA